MRTDISELANSINGLGFSKVLSASGWIRIPFKKDYIAIFQKHHGDTFSQVDIPLSKDIRGYSEMMVKAISEFAEAEGISEDNAMLILQYPNADIIQIRISDPAMQAGTITMDAANKVYDNARKLLAATAQDVIDPRKVHKGRPSSKVSSFIGNCRFGQTEVGSYIVPLVCPLQDINEEQEIAEQLSLFNDDYRLSSSFTRKVTARLMDNLEDISSCAMNGGDISTITERSDERLISVNFLDALESLNATPILDFSISWSNQASMNRSRIDKVRFSNDMNPVISASSIELKGSVKPDISIIGKVISLKAVPDAEERTEGIAEIIYIDENEKIRRAKAILSREDYNIALDAHKRGLHVHMEGKDQEGSKGPYKALTFSVIDE